MQLLAEDSRQEDLNRRTNVISVFWRKFRELQAIKRKILSKRGKRKNNTSGIIFRHFALDQLVATWRIHFFSGRKQMEAEQPVYIDEFAVVNTHRSGQHVISEFGQNMRCSCCPCSRSGHRIFATEDFIYVIGGYDPNVTSEYTFVDVWRFNLITETWEEIDTSRSPLPNCLASFSLVQTYVDGEALIFGGTGVPFGQMASDRLFRVNIDRSGNFVTTELSVNGVQLPKIYGQAMVYQRCRNSEEETYENVVHFIGGTTGHEYNINVWRLRSNFTSRDNWNCKMLSSRQYPYDLEDYQGRYRLELVAANNQLVTFGGGNPVFCAGFERLLTFDLPSNEYVMLPTKADPKYGYPRSRKCHAIVEFDGSVYMTGGCHEFIDHDSIKKKVILNDVWRFDLDCFSWHMLKTSLEIPVYFHSATVTKDGCLYVFGGCTNIASTRRTNQLQRLWLRPPSLKYLATRTVCDAFESNRKITTETKLFASNVIPIVQMILDS